MEINHHHQEMMDQNQQFQYYTIAQQPKSQDDTEEEPFKLALAFRKDGGRVPYEDGGYTGGIMDLETGRQMYFLGKLVKKATRAVKKIVKSPIGKIGLGCITFKFGKF